ncbi:MAG: class II fructose-bisphosphate aldolase [Victivallales bacterium]|nr:class II fructose-bisphosphate aldolase [Victivallales bacterium]
MSIVNFNDILPSARAEKRAVGAFNIANYETAKAVVMAAEAENAPVIIQVYQRLMEDRFIASLGAMMRDMAERSSVPVAVHLDHGVSLEQVKLAIDCGFTSVMLDGSQLPFEENVELTRKAAEYAHEFGVTIEGEIGHVPLNGTEGAENIPLSTPDEARQFALATGVDALAVSVGTAHGYYAKAPEISVDRAREINAVVDIPLVLHGGSDTPMDKVREVIRNGFAKVNVATEFQHAFQLKLQNDINALNGKFLPLDKIMIQPTAAAAEHLRKLIRFFSDIA